MSAFFVGIGGFLFVFGVLIWCIAMLADCGEGSTGVAAGGLFSIMLGFSIVLATLMAMAVT